MRQFEASSRLRLKKGEGMGESRASGVAPEPFSIRPEVSLQLAPMGAVLCRSSDITLEEGITLKSDRRVSNV
jgi:hypothetical protein